MYHDIWILLFREVHMISFSISWVVNREEFQTFPVRALNNDSEKLEQRFWRALLALLFPFNLQKEVSASGRRAILV